MSNNSLSFLGNTTSYISIPNNAGLNFEDQDFTVEWFQYQTDTNFFPRVFQKGTLGEEPEGASIGVSIEGGTFYYWRFDNPTAVVTLNASDYKNKWVHFAVCRASGVTRFYMNGTLIYTLADTTNYTNTQPLMVANESALDNTNSSFGGYLYYFHFIKGLAKYTSNFTVTTAVVPAVGETVLLLTAAGASGTLANTITRTAGTFLIAPESPPFMPAPPQSAALRGRFRLFTDNSRVYYKPHSLASGGIGGVRNARRKARRT
jgi:hypothetical protein